MLDPKDEGRKALCEKHGVRFIQQGVTRENYRELLTPLLTEGGGQGFCVNLSVDTGSVDIMELCNELGALYIDTVNEPWLGFYFDTSKGAAARSNYALRETTLAAKKARRPGSTTAVSCCGANPGMVSFFVKQAVLDIASDLKLNVPEPKSKAEWADLMRQTGVKGIHIAERDTQRSKSPKPPEVFVNTWSVEGFLSEGMQPAELGWGTHEKWMPANAHTHDTGCGAAIYLMQPGANTRVRTLVPDARRAVWLPRHSQRVRSRSPTTSRRATPRARRSTGRPATTPIIRRTTRCSRCTNCSGAPARCRRSTTSSTRTKSSTASTSSACCSTATARMPTGSARSSPSRRRGSWRLTRMPPACR